MKITINNQEISSKDLVFYNWHHLIDWFLKNKINHRHGIVELAINGKSYRHVLSDFNNAAFPDNIDTLEIETRDAYAISQAGLAKTQNLLTTLQSDLTRISSLFRSGDLIKASNALSQFLQAFIPMISFIQSLSNNFQIDFSIQIVDKGQTIDDLLHQLQSFFESLTLAQERADAIELADLLEFEMSPLIDDWLKAISILSRLLPDTPLKSPS